MGTYDEGVQSMATYGADQVVATSLPKDNLIATSTECQRIVLFSSQKRRRPFVSKAKQIFP